MSTFNAPSAVAAATLARSSSINDLEAATAAGFALLPDETLLKQGKVTYAVDTGSVNAYAVTLAVSPGAYADGLDVSFRAITTNTGASTLNVNGLGAVSILRLDGSALQANDIVLGQIVQLRYSSVSGAFQSAANSATNSQASATIAQSAASQASASAAAAAASAALFPDQTGNAGKVLTTNGTTDSWGFVGQTLIERTSNTIITNANKSSLIRITSGTFSQTFDPIANFDADFWVDYENAGTGDITHDPSGAETIDSRATIPQYTNEIRRIRKNAAGTAWETTVRRPFFKSFTSSNATAPVPTGYKLQGRRAIGGGGSGGTGGGGGSGAGANTNSGGGGGGGSSGGNGTIEIRIVDASLLGTTEAVVVGVGGPAQTTFGTGGAGVASGVTSGNDGTAGTAGTAGGTSSSTYGTFTAVSAVGGNAGGAGKLGNKGSNVASGAASAASDATAAAGTSALTVTMSMDFAGAAGNTGTAGSAGVSGTSGGAGGTGSALVATNFTGSLGSPAPGGATQTTAAPAAGNNGTAGFTTTSVGQGGGGSGGGSGSRGGNGGAASGKGGDSAASGAGADGRVDWWGVV
jgi:hypothetical protein